MFPQSSELVNRQAAPPAKLRLLVDGFCQDLGRAGLQYPRSLIERFVVSLLTKRFVILTGLSGSGKTKIAQSFAKWLTPASVDSGEWLNAGEEIPADRASYRVDAIDGLSVQFSSVRDDGRRTIVALPRELIEEWVRCIQANGFTRDTRVRTIRDQVALTTKYSTQLNSFETHLKAAAFALIERRNESPRHEAGQCYEIVAVGADWNSNEHILGYPDALTPSRYVRTQTLDLILRAAANPTVPHFLILDEMNLSHVERYFADFLSAIESGEPLHLYDANDGAAPREGAPPEVYLPPNLYTIGTVNIDETTYMFSPKVLDRANTIEFRLASDSLDAFLQAPRDIRLGALRAQGTMFADDFLAASAAMTPTISDSVQARLRTELILFFDVLSAFGYEYGFRTANEIVKYVDRFAMINNDFNLDDAIDGQIYQKFLPRLNGSRARLEPVLLAVSYLCKSQREWVSDGASNAVLANRAALVQGAIDAADSLKAAIRPVGQSSADATAQVIYPLAAAKIGRMLDLVRQNGFTSFAEA